MILPKPNEAEIKAGLQLIKRQAAMLAGGFLIAKERVLTAQELEFTRKSIVFVCSTCEVLQGEESEKRLALAAIGCLKFYVEKNLPENKEIEKVFVKALSIDAEAEQGHPRV